MTKKAKTGKIAGEPAPTKKHIESLFKAPAPTGTPRAAKTRKAAIAKAAAAAPTGTCTVSASGIKVVKKHVTEQLCGRVANSVGGTYVFVPD